MPSPPKILISGAGVAGPALATFLLLSPVPASQKPHITILERSSTPRIQGQNIDIRGAGVAIIRKLGLETAIRSSTTGEEGVKFVDSNNWAWGSFPVDKTGKVQTGTSDIEILRGRLADILFRRSQTVSKEIEAGGGKGIEHIFGDYLESISQDSHGAHVTFAKGTSPRTFDLIVGADGLQSLTRRLTWGAPSEQTHIHRIGMYGGFFSIPSAPTDSLWRRWFHASGRRGIMVRPGETPDITTVFMYVLNEADSRLREVAIPGRKGLSEQKALLAEYFADAGWECPRLIEAMYKSDDFYYDMVAQIEMPSWHENRVVLLGDAAYCASPISGMGTTLALTGAYNLAGALTKHPEDYAAAFEEYETKTRPIVDLAQKLPLGGKAPYLINPETNWGITVMHVILGVLSWTGIAFLVVKYSGIPADEVEVEEFGFRGLEDWKGYREGEKLKN